MIFHGRRGLTYLATIACVIVIALPSFEALPTTNEETINAALTTQDLEDEVPADTTNALTTASDADQVIDLAAKDTSLVDTTKGHTHTIKHKPIKIKKKKPMGKHKKKKQTFKDKLLPLLLIPFVIQTMLIPLFIMNLKMLALKAMAIGKFAIMLIAFSMFRSWSQNAHSTSVSGNSALMAQNYGFNGGPEFGAIFNGR